LHEKLALFREGGKMSKVEIGEHESLEKALRRFKKKIEREGILKLLKARKHYEKPSERKRRKRRSTKTRF
jgi:small subunit ribosomal protein S21